jgi:hypothetical protein
VFAYCFIYQYGNVKIQEFGILKIAMVNLNSIGCAVSLFACVSQAVERVYCHYYSIIIHPSDKIASANLCAHIKASCALHSAGRRALAPIKVDISNLPGSVVHALAVAKRNLMECALHCVVLFIAPAAGAEAVYK